MLTAHQTFPYQTGTIAHDAGIGHLVDIVDHLETAMQGRRSRAELRHLLTRLETHAGNRFAHEEEYLREDHALHPEQHAGHHALLLDFLHDLLIRFDANDTTALNRAMAFIHTWCEQHLEMHGVIRRRRPARTLH